MDIKKYLGCRNLISEVAAVAAAIIAVLLFANGLVSMLIIGFCAGFCAAALVDACFFVRDHLTS